MLIRNQIYFWSAAFLGFFGFVWLFKDVLLPFVLGIAIAYLLNPLVEYLGRLKINRSLSALLILGVFFAVILLLLAILTPLLYRQFAELAQDLPGYAGRISAAIEPYTQKALGLIGQSWSFDLQELVRDHAGSASQVAGTVLQGLLAGGQAMLGFISVLVLSPIVAYFMIKEWPGLLMRGENLLPRKHKNTITDLLKQMDKKLAGFVRGQVSVAVLLGLAYAIALSLFGLKYGFLIGIMAGLLSIIPMVGSTLGLLVSVSVAWFQSGDLIYVGTIAAIFLIGQLVEGNILTPKLVGDSVGLHPLWVFFALLAGGSLFGILGMLLAVPVAAVIGVLLAFALQRYKASAYYKPAVPRKKKS